jgi:hypothetical protein
MPLTLAWEFPFRRERALPFDLEPMPPDDRHVGTVRVQVA